ncbi:hypothetical protein Tco_0996071 [Tanacetum coccineum]
MEGYVMPKYGNTNWMEDESWTDIIWDDVYNTFYRDKEAETEVAKESEDMTLSIMKEKFLSMVEFEKATVKDYTKLVVTDGMVDYTAFIDDKGKGKEAKHDHLKVNKDDKGKGKLIDDKGKGKEVEHDHLKVNKYDKEMEIIKKLEEDFDRLLKAKKANEAKKAKLAKDAKEAKKEELKAKEAKKAKKAKKAKEAEWKAKEAKKAKEAELKAKKAKKAMKAKEAMLAKVVQISSDEDEDPTTPTSTRSRTPSASTSTRSRAPTASTSTRSRAPIASTSNAQAASTAPRGYRKICMTGCAIALFAPNAPNAPPPSVTRKRKST